MGAVAAAPVTDHRRHKRKYDDHQNDVMDALADVGNGAAEQGAAENHGADPQDTAENIVSEVGRISHAGGSRYRRAESAHDGNEAGEDDGFAPVLFIKIVGPLQMAAAKEERLLAGVQSGTGGAADPVADLISQNRAKHYRKQQPLQGDYPGGGKNPGSHQQRITGQEKADKKTGFDKYDQANH